MRIPIIKTGRLWKLLLLSNLVIIFFYFRPIFKCVTQSLKMAGSYGNFGLLSILIKTLVISVNFSEVISPTSYITV